MNLKTIMLSAVSAVAMTITSAAADAAENFLILDILPLQEGQTIEAAETYFDAVEPIFARYGMTRSDAVLKVANVVRGKVDAQVVNLWQTENPQASFDGIFSDEEYLTHTESRDTIFNLQAATIIVTERQED